MALPVLLPRFFRSKCGDLHLGHSEVMGNPFWMVKAFGRFGFGFGFGYGFGFGFGSDSESEAGLKGVALWLHRFCGWPSGLLACCSLLISAVYWVSIRTVRTPLAKAIKKAARVSRGELWHGTFSPWIGGWDTGIARRGCPSFEKYSRTAGSRVDWEYLATYWYAWVCAVTKLPSMTLLS